MGTNNFVRDKLKKWGLGEYEDKFIDEKVDEETFPLLTYDEMKSLLPVGRLAKFRHLHNKEYNQTLLALSIYPMLLLLLIAGTIYLLYRWCRSRRQHSEQLQKLSTSAEPYQHGDETEQASDEPGMRYKPQSGTSDASAKGGKYEKDILALVYLRGVRHGHTFFLGWNVGSVHPFDDIFYLYKRMGSDGNWEWSAVLCQLKYKETGGLSKSLLINFSLNSGGDYNFICYARLSIEKKKIMNTFIDECISCIKKDNKDANIGNITIKYVLFTNALLNNDAKNVLPTCQDLDHLLQTRTAQSFEQNGFAVAQTTTDDVNDSALNKLIRDEIEMLEHKINKCNAEIEKLQRTNDVRKLDEEKQKLMKLENERNGLENDCWLDPDLHTFFRNVILYSNQLPPTLGDDPKCELAKCLREELNQVLKVPLMSESGPQYVLQEDVVKHFMSQVQSTLLAWFVPKKDSKEKTLPMMTNKATLILKPIRNAVGGLKTSHFTIESWKDITFETNNDENIRSDDSNPSDRIQYWVNEHSVAWAAMKLAGIIGHMDKCTVHDMKYVIDNTDNVIEALKVPCYHRHMFTSEDKLGIDTQHEVERLAGRLCKEILVQDVNKDKYVILITKTRCDVALVLGNTIRDMLGKHKNRHRVT